MDRALERRRGFVEILPLFLNEAEREIRKRKMRVQLDRMVALIQRGIEITSIEVNHRDISNDDRRNRIKRLCEEHLVERLIESAHRSETRHGIPVVRGRVSRVQADRALEFALGAVPVPVLR